MAGCALLMLLASFFLPPRKNGPPPLDRLAVQKTLARSLPPSSLFRTKMPSVDADQLQAIQDFRTELACPLCGNIMQDPHTPDCRHHFCKSVRPPPPPSQVLSR
jgi:hypothetical protein